MKKNKNGGGNYSDSPSMLPRLDSVKMAVVMCVIFYLAAAIVSVVVIFAIAKWIQ